MYEIIGLAKEESQPPKIPTLRARTSYREMMRQACDAANREAKRRKKGQIADDAQELLVLILPRLLLPALKRTPGNNTKVKTHAEAMQQTAKCMTAGDAKTSSSRRRQAWRTGGNKQNDTTASS